MNHSDTGIPVVCLCGPTASGKTDLAIELAARFNGGLISVDSALVYRGMNIGTAKPNSETLAQWPHHLVDIADPWDAYSVADFCRDAAAATQTLFANGKLPILVGGTMLYFKALLNGLNTLPPADFAVRATLRSRLDAEGLQALRAELADVDPVLENRLAANDRQRTLRALEVWHSTGKSLSAWQAAPAEPLVALNPLHLMLWPEPREQLHGLIESRFDAMLSAGFLEEVQALRRDARLHADLPSMRSVGYRQAWQHLDGDLDFATFRSSAIAATRQLAKRQFTWLRQWPATVRVNPYSHSANVHPFETHIGPWLETFRD